MSAGTPRGPKRAGARSTAPRAKRPRRAAAAAWLVVLVLAGAAFVAWKLRPTRPARITGTPAAMEPIAAYSTAVAKVGKSQLRESLPYYRRALAGLATDFCEIHCNYGITLGALSMQYLPRAGLRVPATHSSVERVALVREALSEFDRAVALAPNRMVGVGVRRYRAVVWTSWGLPWEAATAFQDLKNVDSTDAWTNRHYAQYLATMRNPSGARFAPESLSAAPTGTP